MSEQNDDQKQEAGACGPGCSCGTTGGGSRMKWVICGVVALAAVATAAVHVSRTHAAESQAKPQDYATAIPVVATVESAKPPAEVGGWGVPLKTLAELNVVASNTEAVFVVLPSSDADRIAAIQKEVTAAAATITARGTKTGTFLLSKEAQEYGGLVQQVGTPAVLAMCKGKGMAAVKDKEITQESLLKAFVGASRPSGCGPSGCGPGSSGCN